MKMIEEKKIYLSEARAGVRSEKWRKKYDSEKIKLKIPQAMKWIISAMQL